MAQEDDSAQDDMMTDDITQPETGAISGEILPLRFTQGFGSRTQDDRTGPFC